MEAHYIIETALPPNTIQLKNIYISSIITQHNFELLLRGIVHLAIFGIKMRRSQNFSKNSHFQEEKKQTTQNSSSTVKNSKIPHLQQIANFHIFAPGKHLQFSQQIRLLALIHIFCLLPPWKKKKNHSPYFQKTRKTHEAKFLIISCLFQVFNFDTNPLK